MMPDIVVYSFNPGRQEADLHEFKPSLVLPSEF